MVPDNLHLRHCLLFQFHASKNASQAHIAICQVYGDGVLNYRTCLKWFQRFEAGEFDLEDKERSGRPLEPIDEKLNALLEENPCQSTRELANQLNISHTSVSNHLHRMGKIIKLGKWIPHQLTETNIINRFNTCLFLLAKYQKKDFLWKLITGDEKWIFFENPHNNKAYLDPGQTPPQVSKRDIHGKKVMLCVWWDTKGIIYYELLEPNQTVNADRYSSQLRRLSGALDIQRPYNGHGRRKVILQHDNARPHVAKLTKDTILELGWEVLPHPAYSPDLAPSDYYLFRSLQHSLAGQSFKNREEVKKHLDDFFAGHDPRWYREGIRKLPEKWSKVIANDGNNFD